MLTEQQPKVRHYKSGRNALSSFNYVAQSLSGRLHTVQTVKEVSENICFTLIPI